jgi:hypothetical protein
MTVMATFNPAWGSGTTASVTATSGNVLRGLGSKSLCLTNLGNSTAYVRTGVGSTLTATTADYPILPLAQVTITKGMDDNYVAYICAATQSTSLHIMSGEGF